MSKSLDSMSEPTLPFSPEAKYRYSPLTSQSSFRLLELLPGHTDDPVHYNLHLADIGASRKYEALSYTWNDPDIQVSTYCNGKPLQITPNLHAALKALRKPENSTWLWADAISINQEDISERNEQVKYMLDIYRNATGVTVWLGPDEVDESGDSKAQKAKVLVDHIATGLVKLTGHLLWNTPDQFSVTEFPELSKPMPPEEDQRVKLVLQNLRKLDDLSPLTQQNEASFYAGHPHLPALVWLFSRSWFERMWVVQEVNAITNITVLCGNVGICWDRLGLAAAFIPTTWFDIEEMDGLFEGSFIKNADKMRHRSALRTWSVYQIMSYTSTFRASDPRDQIYGKLGLRPLAYSGMCVEPDYDKAVKQVFTDFAISGINHFRNLDVLSFVGFDNAQGTEMPSWVPRWNENLVKKSILIQFGDWNWNASGGVGQENPASFVNDSLFAKGLVLDCVSRIINVDPESWRQKYAKNKQNSLYQLWQDESHINGSEGENSSFIVTPGFLALAASILAGTHDPDHHGRLTDDWAAFQDEVTSYLKLSSLEEYERTYSELTDQEQRWFEYRCRAHACTAGRVLFETKSGHVGLGPQSLQKDDMVCILYGGKVPFILRQEGNHYILIGDSYVHGFMDGEAIEKLRAGELKEQDFQIR